jgi:hypothetical protein
MRHCARPGCSRAAAASLTFDYRSRQVWLSDLGEASPASHDLCLQHADGLRVPRGWTKEDVRRQEHDRPLFQIAV